jgi:DNA gyrase/topoisomerase IV subunit A
MLALEPPVITPEKIEAWIKEVQERPGTAPTIIQYIANRLRHLAERNEELLEENIELRSGKRVEEYERRISHLEYQLDLLKRQYQEGQPQRPDEPSRTPRATPLLDTISVLLFDAHGRVLRIVLDPLALPGPAWPLRLAGKILSPDRAPYLLAVPTAEDLCFVYSSGRISQLSVVGIPPALTAAGHAAQIDWDKTPILESPRAGEELVYLLPLTRLALVDYFIQVSRRGYLKKINISLAESILANHYLGTGVIDAADQTAAVHLCTHEDRLVLVSLQGYCLYLEAERVAYTVTNRMQLSSSDHLVTSLQIQPGQSLLAATQVGKLIHRPEETLELAGQQKTRGLALYSAARRGQGVRVVGAAAVGEQDWCLALHQDGLLGIYPAGELFETRSIPTDSEIIAFTAFALPASPTPGSELLP